MQETVRVTPAELDLEPVVRLSPDSSLGDAARVLADVRVDVILVDTSPLTEITAADVVRAFADGATTRTPVIAAVHERALFVERTVPIDRVVQLMLHAHRLGVVVIDASGVVCGLLTLPVAVAALVEGPSWLGALRVALGITEPAT